MELSSVFGATSILMHMLVQMSSNSNPLTLEGFPLYQYLNTHAAMYNVMHTVQCIHNTVQLSATSEKCTDTLYQNKTICFNEHHENLHP